jgi:hypothetical protein
MGRPKTRVPGIPRFHIGERVIWKSGTKWKMGTILCLGKTKEEAQKNLPAGYKIQYKKTDQKQINKEFDNFIYYVAADTPLFKPGFTAFSVPERHLQNQNESWFGREEKMWEIYRDKDHFQLALEVAKAIHNNPNSVPENIKKIFISSYPKIF